jgi:hypothetical protein
VLPLCSILRPAAAVSLPYALAPLVFLFFDAENSRPGAPGGPPGGAPGGGKKPEEKKKKFEAKPLTRCVLRARMSLREISWRGMCKATHSPSLSAAVHRVCASRVGKKRISKRKGTSAAAKLPKVFPTVKCKLRELKLERIKDFLLMEAEFIRNQEVLRPKAERENTETAKMEEIRGMPLSVGSLEEMIDDNHCIVSSGAFALMNK